MATIKVFNMAGKETGTLELLDSVFGIEPNTVVMHEAVKAHLANKRQGTQSTLTRAEVSGGGKKPWRQKGTGRARQGSTRAPQWTHGGIALGPKPRSYAVSMNKKARKLAICSALSAKVAAGQFIVIDSLEMGEIKTKAFQSFVDAFEAPKALVITPEVRKNVVLSGRNIPGVKTTISSVISVYDILKADKLLVDKEAALKIQEVYAK
ncbi:MAG: 50S ribosomal protein L4 [Clostridia bacterium]|nr:50S ribosomal protein L4 [Clostridia bacterium]MBR2472898.1 50S ribosomal protein L4 [Clostridia bacterium]MBR3865601.1 50S ribosomal protein L4 [Clostridia bacterium]